MAAVATKFVVMWPNYGDDETLWGWDVIDLKDFSILESAWADEDEGTVKKALVAAHPEWQVVDDSPGKLLAWEIWDLVGKKVEAARRKAEVEAAMYEAAEEHYLRAVGVSVPP